MKIIFDSMGNGMDVMFLVVMKIVSHHQCAV
jgi:hypothetical protein